MEGEQKTFNIDNPIINFGSILGYLKGNNGKVEISNSVFKQRLYNFNKNKEYKNGKIVFEGKEIFMVWV